MDGFYNLYFIILIFILNVFKSDAIKCYSCFSCGNDGNFDTSKATIIDDCLGNCRKTITKDQEDQIGNLLRFVTYMEPSPLLVSILNLKFSSATLKRFLLMTRRWTFHMQTPVRMQYSYLFWIAMKNSRTT